MNKSHHKFNLINVLKQTVKPKGFIVMIGKTLDLFEKSGGDAEYVNWLKKNIVGLAIASSAALSSNRHAAYGIYDSGLYC